MTPDDRQEVFSRRQAKAIIKGVSDDDGNEVPITGKSLGEAILFVSEGGGANASDAHIVYGENRTLSYTDCLSVYRDFGPSLRADLEG
jgi:hypothetical protein